MLGWGLSNTIKASFNVYKLYTCVIFTQANIYNIYWKYTSYDMKFI